MLALSIGARAQFVPFVPNQILTAQALNGAFNQFIPISGGTSPVTFTGLTVTGSTSLNTLTVNGNAVFNGPTSIFGPTITNATITGGSINNTPIGATTPSSGAFTTLTSTGATSFTGAASATTQSTNDNSTLIATDAFTNQQIIRSTTTVPLTLVGGTYNQATLGSGFSPVVFASGGVIGSILTIANAGSGYAVGDLVTLAGGNVDATLRVASVSGGGVTSATVLYGGTGYSNGAQVMASMIPPGDRNVILTGALTSNVTFIIANGTYDTASRRPSFANNTTGAFTVTVFLSNGAGGTTGSGYLLPQGSSNNTSVLLQTDGETNVWPIDTPAGIGALSTAAGAVPLTSLATQAANTVVGNGTGSTASPTALAVPSCSTTASALNWTTSSGFSCNTTVNGATLGGATFAAPGAIGSTTASTGAFTTLNASGNDALLYQNSTSQSIPNNAETTVTTWTKVFDRVNANFNASTGTFTAPATGFYQVSSQLCFSSATGVVGVQYSAAVVANGVAVAQGTFFQESVSADSVCTAVNAVVSLAATQTIVIQAYQNTGSARTLLGSAAFTYLSINRIP